MKNTKALTHTVTTIILFLIFMTLVSLPSLQAGFYYDDIPNSQLKGILQIENLSLFDFIKALNANWIANGRLFPMAILVSYPFFYFFNTPFSYHVIQICCIWLSFFSVAWLIKLITKQMQAALLFLLLIPAFWSIRDSHDPLTSYALLLPSVTLFITLSLVFFIKYIETPRMRWQLASLFFYISGLLTYEIGIVTFPAVILLTLLYPPSCWQRISIKILPYLATTLIYLLINFLIRYHSSFLYDGIGVGTLALFPRTFAIQLTASLPLSYWFMKNSLGHMISILLNRDSSEWWIVASIFFISFSGCFYLIRQLSLTSKQKWILTLLGLAFMIVPSILIGTSQKYQQWLTWGIGYLPVYLQYIGIALICIPIAAWTHSLPLRMLYASLFSVLSCMAFLLNTSIVQIKNEVFLAPRSLVEKALQHGVLSGVPPSSILVVNNDGWNTPYFYMQNANVRVKLEKISEENISKVNGNKGKYYLSYKRVPNKVKGEVVVKNSHFKVIGQYRI